MQPQEFRISPHLAAALSRNFAAFRQYEVDDTKLPAWLLDRQRVEQQLPPKFALQLRQQLENTLLLEGGEEGRALLDAFDALENGSGSPAIVIRGLPHGQQHDGIMPLIAEAVSQCMSPRGDIHKVHETLTDEYALTKLTCYSKAGVTRPHQDRCDYVVLYGKEPGVNPRGTVLRDAGEFIEQLAERAQAHEPRAFSLQRYREVKRHFRELLMLPIWPFESDDPEVKQHGVKVITEFNLHYAPIIYPNPAFDPMRPSSPVFNFVLAPFSKLGKRVADYHELADYPPEMVDDARLLAEVFKETLKCEATEQDGVKLDDGDLLLIHNRQIIHAGGPFTYAELPEHLCGEYRPRKTHAVDSCRNREMPFNPQPRERWQDAILPEGGGLVR